MSVLFVTACSLTKEPGGVSTFDQGATIAAVTPRDAERLASRRNEVRELVKGGETANWQGVPLKDLVYNRDLVRSSEFGGRKGGTYMPALDRYQGRFFQALGDAGKARCKSSDSLLIVSGLYGLLRASEPVQLYSCPLLADVAAIWQRDALLTDIVCAYVKRNDVLRVFDLTAMEAYRELIDWRRVAADGTDVLHCFDTMAAGESALTSFGRFFRYLLSLDDDELIGLDPELPSAEFGTCRLRSFPEPPSGCPTETWPAHMAAEVLSGGNPDAGSWQFTPTARQHGPAGRRRHDAGPWEFTTTSRFRRDAKAALEEILKAVVEICNAPMSPHGNTVKPLSWHDGLWRYRLGEYRLVYEPDPTRRVVRLLRFGPRGHGPAGGDIYSGL